MIAKNSRTAELTFRHPIAGKVGELGEFNQALEGQVFQLQMNVEPRYRTGNFADILKQAQFDRHVRIAMLEVDPRFEGSGPLAVEAPLCDDIPANDLQSERPVAKAI